MENYISCILKDINKIKSIQQIEKDLLVNNYKQSSSLQNLNKTQNVADIKVVSPFYPKPNCKNQNCFCPYHRKMRIKQRPLKKIDNKTFNFKTAKSSPNSKLITVIKENLLRENQRLTLKKNQPSKLYSVVNWQVRKKVDSRNFEFEEFIKQFEKILLKKTKFNTLDLHRIKSSVGEIFKYIYTHLDQDRQIVQDHISNIEKDKDFTTFYIQRFIELKERKAKRGEEKEEKKLKIAKQMMITGTLQKQLENKKRKKPKGQANLYEKRELCEKIIKSRSQKLIAQQFLEDIDCGQEIEEYQIKKFAELEIEKFEENCEFIENMINEKDKSMLYELLTQIVQKAKKRIGDLESDECMAIKNARLDRLMNLINAKIEELSHSEGKQQECFRLGTSSNSLKTRVNSKSCNKKVTIVGKISQSPFKKSAFNQIKRQNSDSQLYKDDNLNEMEEKANDDMAGEQRQSLKNTMIFFEAEKENTQLRTPKSGKLQLAKYRRLSHNLFYRKKIFGDQQQPIFQKIKIIKLEDISQELEKLAYQFAQKKQKLREIERKIKDFSLQKYMINENDSLITAKRKIRIIKSLLKDEEFDHYLKEQIKEYLALVEEQICLKNRRWAKNKIRNMLEMGAKNEEVQLLQDEEVQGEKYQLLRLIGGIFGKNSKLIFYQMFETMYQEKEINFQQQIMHNKDSCIIHQKSQTQVNSGKKNIQEKRNHKIFDQQVKKSALIQVGLNSKCISNANYFENQQRESQQFYESGQFQDEEQNIQVSEKKYMSLFNKLSILSKL